MFKKIFILVLSAAVFTSCVHEKKGIEFKKVVNLELGNLSKESATLRASAVFMNLSDEPYSLNDLIVDFSIDGKDVGTIVIKTKKIIPANSEFTVPIQYTYETSSFVEEGHEPSSSYAVQLIGDLNLKTAKDEESSAKIKYATTYEYLTKKEIRTEKRESRKEERQKRKEAKKAGKEE